LLVSPKAELRLVITAQFEADGLLIYGESMKDFYRRPATVGHRVLAMWPVAAITQRCHISAML
jgi:hypothetical protein